MGLSVFKDLIAQLLSTFRRLSSSEWVYVAQEWDVHTRESQGWLENSILETQRARWPSIVKSVQGSVPLTTAYTYTLPENTRYDVNAHNVIVSFAYVLALASREKDSVSVLDWGGGVGLYRLLSKVLFPELNVEYSCFDTPILCSLGRELMPDATFYENSTQALGKNYDLIIASSSLQYFENWQEILEKLAKSSRKYLYIARLPLVQREKSFVALQRCYTNKGYGYDTEFRSWFLNRREFLESANKNQLILVREFLTGESYFIRKAPEQNLSSQSFLFRPAPISSIA